MQLIIRTNIGKLYEDMPLKIHRQIINAATEASKELYDIVQYKYVQPISRTGEFARAVKLIPAKVVEENRVRWGIEFGTPYARAIVGPSGTSVIIRPKAGRVSTHEGSEPHLAIPMGPALNSDGSKRFTSPWQVKGIRLVVYGGNAYLATKPTKNTFIAYFLLKDEVEVQRQIDPDSIRADAKRLITVKLREYLKDITK